MEKIRDSIRKELPPLRLYLDEVQELFDFVSDVGEGVTLQAEGFRLDSPQELKELPVGQIHNLSISADRPYLRVELRNSSAEIFLGGGDVESEGVASRIENILLKGKAKVYFLPSGFWVSLLSWMPLWFGIAIKNAVVSGIGIAIVIMYFVMSAMDGRFKFKRYSTVLPMSRKEVSSFWVRNKDQLL